MSNTRVPKSRIVEAACRTDFLSFFQWCFHILASRFDAKHELASLKHGLAP